jgi:hypothetical protein
MSARAVPFSNPELRNNLHRQPRVLGDRFEYWADDEVAQFHVIAPPRLPAAVAGQAPPPEPSLEGCGLRIRLLRGDGGEVASQTLSPLTAAKAHVQVRVATLPVGAYQLEAVLLDATGAPAGDAASFAFTRTDQRQDTVAFPTGGVAIELEEQAIDPEARWPVTAAVPLPLGAVRDVSRLAVVEDGKPITSQITAAAHWSGASDASVQWAHVSFLARYDRGKPRSYRLRQQDGAAARGAAVRVEQNDKTITLDTGALRVEVNRKGFSGIERAWRDATGESRYDLDRPVIDNRALGQTGPYLIDGRLVRYEARFDKNATVELEESGPFRATVVARGWFVRDEKQSESLCQFVTRITAIAGESTLRVSHHVILTYDTRVTRLADVGFPLAVVGAQRFALGVDGQVTQGELPAIPAEIKARRDGTRKIPGVYLLQEKHDALRVVGAAGEPITGKRSDGWFSALPAADAKGPRATLVLRDIWQKFPKEVELSRQAMTLHLWPAHGLTVFDDQDEVSPQNLFKFQAFHQGKMLDLNLPNRYFEALEANPETWIECWPQNALNGNGQGLAMNAEFELSLDDRDDAAAARQAALAQRDPAAMPAPAWSAATNAAGRIAPYDPAFADTEDAFLNGMLSYNRSVERGQSYGMWIWPDTHNHWKIAENRPNLHRVWQNSHYHQISNAWLMWLRSGSPDMLRWARSANEHYRNVATVNYGELVDEGGRKRWRFQSKIPGGMYHCKAPTPWGSSDYGMVRNNDHIALAAHWTDPDAHLWSWLMGGVPRGRDLYQLWHESVRAYGTMIKGTRREANMTLAVLITAYQFTHDPDLLPAIHGLGLSLRLDEPLTQQNPGPFWHALWINRYYEQTRDPEYVPFILEHAGRASLADTWLLGLSALAYEITKDQKHLAQHFTRIERLPLSMLHAPGHLYDGYGMGPGPLGFRWGEMTWGHYLRQLHSAGVTKIEPESTDHGAYPVASTRLTTASPAGIVVLALEPDDRQIALTLPRRNPHTAAVRVIGPDGAEAFTYDMKPSQVDRKDTAQSIGKDGKSGLYRLEFRAHDVAAPLPLTDLPVEAAVLDEGRGYQTTRIDAWLAPAGEFKAIELSFTSGHDDDPFNARLYNAAGQLIGEASLLRTTGLVSATVALDPTRREHAPPWRMVIAGPGVIVSKGAGPLLLAAQAASITRLAPHALNLTH